MTKNKPFVMLIDDDYATNYIHKRLITELDLAKEVIYLQYADEALEYLKQAYEKTEPIPEIIFLDLNMAGMDGWDFIEEYEILGQNIKLETKLYMLTTSQNPDDKKKADNYTILSGFFNKPLTPESLHAIWKHI